MSDSEDNDRRESDKIWEAFMAYDTEKNGTISVNDFKKAMEYAGEKVTDDECYWMISMQDPENKGVIQFSQFKAVILEKRENERGSSE